MMPLVQIVVAAAGCAMAAIPAPATTIHKDSLEMRKNNF